MSDKSGTYIIQTKDGYRIVVGPELEQRFHRKMTESFRKFVRELPYYKDFATASSFAKEVDYANETQRGVVSIDTFKDFNIDEI